MTVKGLIDQIYDELVTIRRNIHKRPELGFEEFETQKLIMATLEKWGIKYEPIAKTGVLGYIEGTGSGPCLAIRADIDALPIQEAIDVPFKSEFEGKMHACGHDVHTSILLGSAYVLDRLKNSFSGTVKLFFQPAEETSGGALPMIDEGCLENPKVDAVIGLHVMPYYDAGVIELKYGQLNASSDYIRIEVKGKSGHGAYPDLGVDAVLVASQIVNNLQSLVSRMASPLDPVVFSIGTMHGGKRANIICDHMIMEGTLRTLNLETRKKMKEQMISIVEGISSAYGASCDVIVHEGYEPLINDDVIMDVLYETAKEILPEESIKFKDLPSLGVEDFSFFSNRVPGAFFHLGCGNKAKGIEASLHSENFQVDEMCIKTGVEMEVEAVLALLKVLQS